MSLKSICTNCKKRPTCKTLCAPAEKYVNQDGAVYEEQAEDEIKVYPRWNEVQASTAPSGTDSNSIQGNYIESNFADGDGNNPFSNFTAAHLITQVFILRFFEKWSFTDIAFKFDLKDKDAAKSIYFQAVNRMKKGLEVIDYQTLTKQNAITSLRGSQATQLLNPAQRDYLFYAVFNLDIDTISEITGRKYATIRSGIHRVKRKLESGAYSFEDLVTPGQWEKTTKKNSMAGLKQIQQNRKTA